MPNKSDNHYLKRELYQLIKEDESIFDFIQENSFDGLFYWDIEKPENVWMNAKFWATLGYDPQELPLESKDWQDIINHDDLNVALNNVNRLSEAPSHPYDQTLRYKHKNGSIIRMHCRSLTIRNSKEKTLRMLSALHDITNIKEPKNKLADLSSIIQYSTNEIYLFDTESLKFVYANNSALDNLGYTMKELKLKTPADIKPHYTADKFHKLIEPLKNGNTKVIKSETTHQRKNGSTYDVSLVILHGKYDNREVYSAMVVDPSKQTEAEKQKNYLSAIIEHTDNISVIKDLNLRVIATNESFAKAAGKKSVDELIGKTDAEIFNIPPDQQPVKGYMEDELKAQKLKKGEKIVQEEIVIYPDKSKRTFLTTKFPVYDKNDKLIATANISTDITHQKEIEKALKESELLLNETGKLGKIGGWKLDVKTQKLTWTEEVYKIHEVPIDYEPTLDKAINFYTDDSKRIIEQAIEDAVKNKKSYNIELEIKTAKGNKLQVKSLGKVQYDKEGKLEFLFGTFQDITKEKQAEQALQESRDTLDKLFENSVSAKLWANHDGIVVRVNNAAAKLFECKKEDLIGLHQSELHPTKSQQEIKSKFEKNLNEGTGLEEAEIRTKKNNIRQVEIQTTRIEYKDAVLVQGVFVDITERKESRKRLNRERQQMLSLLNTIPEPIYVADLETHEILFANDKQKELFGQDIIGKKCYEAIHGEDKKCEFCLNKFDLENEKETIRWETYSAPHKRNFFTINKLVTWDDDIKARFQISIDITERKKAEQSLKENEEKIRLIGDNIPKGLIYQLMVKPSGDRYFTYLSKNAEDFYEHSMDELMNDISIFFDRVVPEDRPEFIAVGDKSIRDMSTFDHEFKIKKKSGEIRWHRMISEPRKELSDGNIIYDGIDFDITDQKTAEQALKESQEQFKTISDSANDAIILIDNEAKVIFWNHAAEKIFGYRKTDILGKNIHNLLSPEKYRNVQNKGFKVFKETGKGKAIGKTIELEAIRKSGEVFPVEVSLSAIKIKEKWNAIGIIRDITERKEQEERMLKRLRYEEKLARFSSTMFLKKPNVINESLKYLLEAAECGRVYIFENFIDEQNRLSMKQTFEACAQNTEPQIDNLELQHLIYDEDGFSSWTQELAKNNIISTLVKDLPKEVQTIMESQNIKSILIIPIFVFQKWYGFIGFDNTHDYTLWNNEDIDLLRTASEILGLYIENHNHKLTIEKQNSELKEAVATKDKFFSIISHDLKSPFSTIIGFVDILMKRHAQYDNEKREKTIIAINNSVKSTFKLLENLLTWSRSQSGAINYLPENLSLKVVLFETVYDLQGEADKKSIKIQDEIEENEMIYTDRNMLTTVLRNLVSNAIKFTNRGGSILISTKTKNNITEVSVKDNGTGIPKNTMKGLFSIDANTSTNGTENETGTGLGLILCKEFVNKMGGEIWVESELGKGSIFYFTVPKQKN